MNLFADMGVQPATLQSGLIPASPSTDTTAPVSAIQSPASGSTLNTGTSVTVSGTASDAGGMVSGVEVSTDGGTTWHPAIGRTSWSYSWTPSQTGQETLLARAVDDSGNIESAHGVPVTVVPQVCPCTIWNSSVVPGTIDSQDGGSIVVGLKFRADSDGSVLGVRFYKATTNTGTHVGHLFTSTGTLLGTATFTGESSSGWQQVNFPQPIAISANTTYVVTYYAPKGHYSAGANAFARAGVDDPPLHALANGTDGSNGVYLYTTSDSVFPTNTYSASNYWVDVVYTASNIYALSGTLSGPGGAGATVSLSGPESLSTSADSSGNYAFDGVTNGTYTVTPSRSGVTFNPSSLRATVNGTSLSGVNFTATVTNPLSISGTITGGPSASVALSGAAAATVTADSGGNYSFTGLLSGDYAVTPSEANILFTPSSQSVTLNNSNATQVNFQGQACACTTIWSTSTTPAVIDAMDTTPVELGVKFRSDVNGVISGLRFYKASTNTGTHIGHLWSGTGSLLATVTFNSESASGWQQASFSSPVAITPNTTYVASYFAPNGHYSADSSYFASQGVDNGSLHALANGVDGPDGVYLYSSSGGFPTSTYSSTNYWVDVLFSLGASHHISGTIAGANGPNATVALSGGASLTTTADASGNYSFSGVYPGTYSVTPTTGVGYLPGTQSVTVSSADVTAVNFSTSSNCPCNSIWAPSVKPTTIDTQDTHAVEVGTNFTADADGYVIGIRYYKASTNTGQHVVNLWNTGSGNRLATANGTGESASGWQQVVFTNPVPVSANTAYLASYFAPAGHYSGDGGFFANAGVDNAPLHALANTGSAPNGVYVYSATSAHPSNTYNAANYWVDVLYAPATRYAIGGNISGAGGSGASVTLSGAASATVTADSSGNFTFTNLANGTYTVTPSVSNGVVTPANQTITINGAHALGVNFTSAQAAFTLSGTVTGAPNDTVALTGAATQSVVTDGSGNYSFTGLSNGSYTVTPGASGFTVTPGSQAVSINGANATGVNFSATPLPFAISGTITGGGGSTVTLSGGAGATTTADASGNYSFPNVNNGSYVVTPAKSGLVFTPTTLQAVVQGANVANANFSVPANCPCDTLWQPNTMPSAADSGDNHAGEYGVKFRADADGYISGIRFFKSGTNTGTHLGDLWSSTGNSLATATFSSESASGWQQVFFSSPVPVVANTTYVASYYTPTGHYAADSAYFSSQGTDVPPLHGLANGVDGSNGVYSYASQSAFPTSSFNAANYWVDVIYLPTTTYSIGGTITGSGFAGATVTLSGGASASTTVNASGGFTFSGLANGTYTVTPSNPGSSFSPASQTATINNGHALGLTFSSVVSTYTLSGTISGAGGAGATVALTGQASASTTADSSGAYTFTGLTNGSYTLTASKTGFVISPSSQAITISNANATANFSSVAQTYTISGTISGSGGSGATVSLTGAATATTTASGSGTYSFAGLANGSYTVTASKSGYVMSPSSQAVTISSANANANFSSAGAYSITGTISGSGGSGATVNLTGASTATVTANSSGAYTFTGIANGSYTVKPTKSGFAMSPASLAVTINGASGTANFSSAAVFTLSGTITGPAASGATVVLSGVASATTTTNSSGAYSFSNLLNGSYTVTPSKAGYVMSPTNRAVTISGANATASFSSVVQTFTISGTISGFGGIGATVTLSGAASAQTTTGLSGTYTFAGLANGAYTITPKRIGFTMSPTNKAVTVSGANVTAVNFTAN